MTSETAEHWLAVFRKNEPDVLFTVSAKKPAPPKWNRETRMFEVA